MPIKKPKKKRTKDSHANNHPLELLGYKAQMAVANYLDRAVTDESHISMVTLFKQYKAHKEAVHKSLLNAFKFLVTERYIPAMDDPPYYRLPEGPPPSKAVIKTAKKHINRIAKKVWKK